MHLVLRFGDNVQERFVVKVLVKNWQPSIASVEDMIEMAAQRCSPRPAHGVDNKQPAKSSQEKKGPDTFSLEEASFTSGGDLKREPAGAAFAMPAGPPLAPQPTACGTMVNRCVYQVGLTFTSSRKKYWGGSRNPNCSRVEALVAVKVNVNCV
jgi:hypothetical protein